MQLADTPLPKSATLGFYPIAHNNWDTIQFSSHET